MDENNPQSQQPQTPGINWQSLQVQQPKTGVVAQAPRPQPQQQGQGNDLLGGLTKLLQHVAQNPAQTPSNQDPNTLPGTSLFRNGQDNNASQPLNQDAQSFYDTASKHLGEDSSNPTLQSYLKTANPNLDPTVTPWCAGFVGSVLNASGTKGTGSLAAKSYLNFGQPTNNPQKGDIVVFNDLTGQNRPEHGHVGFVDHVDPKTGQVYTLGGNQSGSVSVKAFPLGSVAGFRVPPSGQQVKQFASANGIQDPKQVSALPDQAADSFVPHVLNGIAHVETGGSQNPYGETSKPAANGDRAYGKYQIMGNNIPAWTKAALGTSMSPRQFLASPEAQEKTAQYQVSQMMGKYKNANDVASVWFSGRPVAQAGAAKDAYGTTVPQYLSKFQEGYKNSVMSSQLAHNGSKTSPLTIAQNKSQTLPIPGNKNTPNPAWNQGGNRTQQTGSFWKSMSPPTTDV